MTVAYSDNIIDQYDRPVIGAAVSAVISDVTYGTATTDILGVFTLNVAPGVYTIQIRVNGSLVQEDLNVSIGLSPSLSILAATTADLITQTYGPTQLAIDTTLHGLRVFDGATAGGNLILPNAPAIAKLGKLKSFLDYVTDRTLWPAIANYTSNVDLTAYLAAAIADGLSGNSLYFPEGGYSFPNGLNLLGIQYLSIIGESRGGSILVAPQAGTFADFGAAGAGSLNTLYFSSLTVNNPTPRTSGSTLRFRNITDVWVEDLTLAGQYVAIEMGAGTGRATVGGAGLSRIVNTSAGGVGILINGDQTVTTLQNVILEGNGAAPSEAAIKITAAHDVKLDTISTTFAGIGLKIAPTTGQMVEQIWSRGCTYDTGTGNGVDISGLGTVRVIRSTNDWSATNAGVGFHIANTLTSVSDIQLLSFQSVNNGREGIWAEKCSGLTIANSVCAGNSTLSASTYDGIRLGSGVDRFGILGNVSGAYGQFTNAQKYGLNIESGSRFSYRVQGNDFGGNTTGALLDSGTATSTKSLVNNV